MNLYQTNSRVYVVTMHASAYRDILSILMTCLLIIMAAVMMPWILIHYFTRYFTNRVTVLRNEMKKQATRRKFWHSPLAVKMNYRKFMRICR